ncbi:hypothetical protein WKI68_06505 [Streptomyces sp. MS1.HAVA.3]|uniref:Uncharacterized protein n=1 Tax=Streptomyces caledonius TaxID=3134107 RepID=A0ABU8U056_9ACTN
MAQFTTAGKPRDLLLHPDSKKLYVGSDDLPGTADVNESGLHVLDPADGKVRSTVGQAPGPTGTLGRRAVRQLVTPLPGTGRSSSIRCATSAPPRTATPPLRARGCRVRPSPTPDRGPPPRRCWSHRAPYCRRSTSPPRP